MARLCLSVTYIQLTMGDMVIFQDTYHCQIDCMENKGTLELSCDTLFFPSVYFICILLKLHGLGWEKQWTFYYFYSQNKTVNTQISRHGKTDVNQRSPLLPFWKEYTKRKGRLDCRTGVYKYGTPLSVGDIYLVDHGRYGHISGHLSLSN